jgi:plasmid maintenance system antidote protein VapI
MDGGSIEPIHPGETPKEDFIGGSRITQNKSTVSIGVPTRWIDGAMPGKRGTTADTALRLGKCFGVPAQAEPAVFAGVVDPS